VAELERALQPAPPVETPKKVVNPRSRPAEVRMPLQALCDWSWVRAGHLAVVDSCEPGEWDTGGRWIGSIIKTGKEATLAAGLANLAEGTYTRLETRRKRIKGGRSFDGTFWSVSAHWTTRNGKRRNGNKYVPLDTAWLDRNPRAGDDKKRIYHLLAFEQRFYGACALATSQIAEQLGIEGTGTQTPAQRVWRAINSLIDSGDAEHHAEGDYYTLQRYEPAPPDHARIKPNARRAAFARALRRRLGEEWRSTERDDSEPHLLPLGTALVTTQNHPTTRNDEERLENLTAVSGREFLDQNADREDNQELRAGSDENPALTENSEGWQLPDAAQTKLRAIFGAYAEPGRKAHTDAARALACLAERLGENQPATDELLRQLDRVKRESRGSLHAAYPLLKEALSYVVEPLDETWEQLKQERQALQARDLEHADPKLVQELFGDWELPRVSEPGEVFDFDDG
jgi:hypothetical protein